jgi:hypothetical protein
MALPFTFRWPGILKYGTLNNLVRLSLSGGGAVPALPDCKHEGGDGGDATALVQHLLPHPAAREARPATQVQHLYR